ncbi:type IV toxin-antitoxin system AbiEi family antitoxin domain-containing protein [Parafrigoribacterium soli]|uniref:type IV toxin-antitoxin system AbiEi family antitoxin domain-containing protein n=1 Tax=Parafrigoribacterium soli TaxID=3144663 RepID=UPI0032F007F3
MSISLLCGLGHVASVPQLRENGLTEARVRAATRRGEIVRLRRGTYGCAHLETLATTAARAGGAVTCVSLLREFGVWAGHGTRAHIQISPKASHVVHGLLDADGLAARFHWERPRFGMETAWRVTRMQALWQAIRCLDEENAIAALESAIHTGFLPIEDILRLWQLAPRRLHEYCDELVLISGSGNETFVRLRLQRVGHRVVPQGTVPGLGHQDLVVNDCLGLEIDSRAWHDNDAQRVVDYDRDLHAAGLGRPTIRILPSHIHSSWPVTLAVIERAAADAAGNAQRRRGRVIAGVAEAF